MINILISLFFFSCQDLGAGTLGSLGVYKIDENRETVKQKLDSLLSDDKFKVPEEYQDYLNWDERGYSFLTYWTVYYKEDNSEIMYWISLSKNSVETQVYIRQVFDFESNKWIKAVDVKKEDRDMFNSSFEKNVIQILGSSYAFEAAQ
ncbi:MAG: hypothetical protein HYZ14_07490 [Bacteroidetes bacterium]|nr:hypothetical protein [Bacteroidota bacterium]